MPEIISPLFPEIQPYRSGHLSVDGGHSLYWEECGNPNGQPVLFLHGGPGAGLSPSHRQFFDPAYYRIVLFDQRGAGKSTPLGEYRHNTTPLLIQDIEAIRTMLKIDQWLVFGGSWGSTLALAYGEAHPSACLGFVLRGIFLCTQVEVEWFINGMKNFFPEVYAEFAAAIPSDERHDLLDAYAKRLFSDDPALYLPAARSWSRYEGSCLFLEPQASAVEAFEKEEVSLGLGRLEAHYMVYGGFMEEDQLIKNIDKISHLPAVIVQGRYDVICPPTSAFRLHAAWPESVLKVIPTAGHAALEPGTAAALVAATEQFKLQRRFE
ncbi:prolyl aminopeptidase [Solimicrobium silvestre]|uniref:Proline iminopeptidase n=1 Tax=Solimicrobium silvestre TaxID=2099400 RepID=A0A2S9GXB7_9BURK|nr:prolyl aminopeptidase [Solimicrobium silvestre]PRC92365.1 Prolyl aminopeptidase [Solimicrobium silvestre]